MELLYKGWRSWLRHCATNREAAGSIPDGVIEVLHLHIPSNRTVVLGLTQPLTEMSTRRTVHCATSRKVAGSIPDSVIEIFHWHNPSSRTMALGLTHPLTEMSTRNISWGVKSAGALDWQPYHLHVPIVLKSGSLNLLEPSGPVQACKGIAFLNHVWKSLFKIQLPYNRRTVQLATARN